MDINITPRRKLTYDFDEEDKEQEGLNIECNQNIVEQKVPKVGMEFDNDEAAYKFYNEYAKSVGFSIRKQHVHRVDGRVTDRTFCCSCEGFRREDKRDKSVQSHRPKSRTGCGAMRKINSRYTGNFTVVDFVAEHRGHDVVTPTKSFMLRSHRRISSVQTLQADDIANSGIAPRAGFTLMAKQVGGRENLGFVLEDYKNYLKSKRTIEMKVGDTGGVLEYLQRKQIEDPNFFYGIQVDANDCIANILWIDARMKADYARFGDVMSFDTTFRKNKDGQPFALFVGVNHHKQTIIFGAALLYDETIPTFVWLFDTFSKAMSEKLPQTILTDQDAAMANALSLKWPETCHRLCIWHIYQNAAIHLSNVFASFPEFLQDFSSCVYDHEEEEEFVSKWHEMLEKYGLQTNSWLERLFKVKEKWALVYGRQTFCADMTTTQRSESMNAVLKRYVGYKHHLLQFFHHFDRLVDDRRYEELKADLKTSHTTLSVSFPVQILKHAVRVYTHEVFELFQNEVHKSYDSQIHLCSEIGESFEYKVTPFGKHFQHKVSYNSSQNKISCSCKKFEFAGILCSHALKVFSERNILKIPEVYILKRWTKKARRTEVEQVQQEVDSGSSEYMNEKEENQMIGVRYRELCSMNNQLATQAALTSETFRIAKNGLLKIIEEVNAKLEKRTTVKPNVGRKSTVNSKATEKPISSLEMSKGNIIVSRTEEHQSIKALHDNAKKLSQDGCMSNEVVIKGWKKKKQGLVKSGKRPRSGLEKSVRKRKSKKDNESLSKNGIVLEENNKNLDDETNSVDVSQVNSLPSLSQNLHISQISPTITEPFNFSSPYNKNDEETELSLSQLLQLQLKDSREFEEFHLSNFTPQGQYKKANIKPVE